MTASIMKRTIPPREICDAAGGRYSKKNKTCSFSMKKAREVCQIAGGDYDNDDETCDLPMDDPDQPKSIFSRDGVLVFFLLQVVIGSATVILGTYYSPTQIPSFRWVSYLILAIAYFLSTGMYWYKLGSWKESFLRSTVSLATILFVSIITGWLYNWDATLYWNFHDLAGLPVIATIYGVIVSALISIILVNPDERKAVDDPGNDFSGILTG